MWVVKLGGSLFDSNALVDWLDQLTTCGQPLVIVPGGGPFADQVRQAQQRWSFDDRQAHAMALLAMDQMGYMLCGLDARCRPADDAAAIASVLAAGATPVWLGSRSVLQDTGIAANWQVTSDSLALWLASRIGAAGVVLIKSAMLPDESADIAALQDMGVLDQAFGIFAEQAGLPIHLLNRNAPARVQAVFAGRAGSAARAAI
jgi:aspartokinase-like uncharacterized kinase